MEPQKSPSYVKISCAISGYNKYPKTSLLKVSPAPKESLATNNNVSHQNGSHDDDPAAQLEYKPGGSNFVKGLSQKFESYNQESQPMHNHRKPTQNKSKSTSVLVHQSNSVHTPHEPVNGSIVESEGSITQCTNSQGTSQVSSIFERNETVDSHNIDFRKARLAFSQETSNISSSTIDQPAEKPKSSSLSPEQHQVPYTTPSAKDLSQVNQTFDSIGANTSSIQDVESVDTVHNSELHLDLNGASRQNGHDEIDRALVVSSRNSRRDLDGHHIHEHNMKLEAKSPLMNGDALSSDDVLTPSHVTPSNVEVQKDLETGRLSQSSTSLDIVNDTAGSAASLCTDHQVAGSSGALSTASSSSVPSKDGKYFLSVVDNEETRMNEHVQRTEGYLTNNSSLGEEGE